ncbi:MAG TPA: VWA domain-containing protein [Vicinamibacterales bacterium]|nr:VWA domain-containing protein [Vicinamibacterales bacterium]
MIFTLLTSFMICALIQAQTQKPPVFRTRTDLLQLDVTVLDKAGKPVKGLTADDFVLLEDKRPQKIEAFSEVDIPDAPPPSAVWERKVSPDVISNEIDNQRIFVIVIDDALSMGLLPPLMIPDPGATAAMKKSAASFIGALGPTDLAALVFTNQTRLSQNLTTDHARLIKALEAYPVDGGGILGMPGQDRCLAEKYSVGTVQGVVNGLAAVPDRRKAVVFFGGEMPWAQTVDRCFTYARWQGTFAMAQQAHVTINPVDTMGLRPDGITGKAERYLIVAENTGGHAVVATNDFEPGLRQVFVENSSYYLMAYAPTNEAEDGTFRRISLTVKDHPEFDVRTRRNYWAPKNKISEREKQEPPPSVAAMAGILPLSKLPLRATAAAFAAPGGTGAVVAISLGLKQPAVDARTPEQVEVLVKAYTADGDERGSNADTITITIPAARRDADTSRYEVISRMELEKPGKYELRLSAHSAISDSRGSVYVDVEVPDFKKDRVSLSGVIVNSALAAAPSAPLRVLRDLTSLTPTTERAFVSSDIVMAFLRVYQGGTEKLAAVPLKAAIVDTTGKSIFSHTESVPVDRFTAERSADYQLRLPLATLTAGDYLLSFETTVAKTTARRDVRFTVR